MKKLRNFLQKRASGREHTLGGVGFTCLVLLGLLGMLVTAVPQEQPSLAAFGLVYPVLYDWFGRRSLVAVSVSVAVSQVFPVVAPSFNAFGVM